MHHVRKLSTLLGCALVASSMIFTSATPAAKPAAAAKPHRFKVGGAVFTGSAKTICVIEGKWKDGEPFRYEAWDECSEMRMRRPPPEVIRMLRRLVPMTTLPSRTSLLARMFSS